MDALDALRDTTERWQAVHAARVQGAGWEQIGSATGVSAEQARTDYTEAIERRERCGIDRAEYRRVL